jgi:uncharacterized ferritin-like protein (DUF455 family)
MTAETLSDAALAILTTVEAEEKAYKTREQATRWFEGHINEIGCVALPDRPARPLKPELLPTNMMPKRRKAGSRTGKIALLHALSHIELNAIDLAWDIIGRFSCYAADNGAEGFSLPRPFFDQWVKVADDEAKHFLLLQARLKDFDAAYGDLPAHDGLWESAIATADDFAARLAIVPMVLEARGLDVTPAMITTMERQEDDKTAEILQIIHDDEITHVEAGTIWFKAWCDWHGYQDRVYWQELVRTYFKGALKPPFNDPSRIQAGLIPDWYEPLAEIYADE